MKLDCLIAASLTLSASAELGSLLRSGHANHADFGGTVMERTFTMYNGLPVGEDELKTAGWTKNSDKGCDPHLGYSWSQPGSAGPSKSQPLTLYTTAGGQPSGVGVAILGYGEDPLPAPQKKWATEKPLQSLPTANAVQIDVAFRSGDIICSGEKDQSSIGDTLIVNPKGSADTTMSLPLTETEADAAGWHRGSCFDGMGWHRFLDTSLKNNKLSWKAENLFPVVTMFHEGQINAIFFLSTINQVSIPGIASNEWEPKSLSSSEMCANTCDKDCTFSGLTSAGPFSTMHIYFNDHKSVTCDSSLQCGLPWPIRGNCCQASVVV